MRILVITNLFPPHHAGTYDFRCETVVGLLRKRGHELRVLTSSHGLRAGQRGVEVDRSLLLNGVHGHEAVTHVTDLKDLEFHNNKTVQAALESMRPELVYVWSLSGVSKSILWTLTRAGLPVAFDVADAWPERELREDPWLAFWNREQLSLTDRALRTSLEFSRQRDKWDEQAPTRPGATIKRMPEVFGGTASPAPGSIRAFHLRHVQFANESLMRRTLRAGFHLEHCEVIHPHLDRALMNAGLRPPADTANRLLIYATLEPGSGVLTALKALEILRRDNPGITLTVVGQGDAEYTARVRSHAVRHGLPVEVELITDTVSEMPAIFARHDLLLHTAETDDLFTMAPVKAMAAGLPVIATTLGTVGEYLRHGENCIHVAPNDPEDLADRVREVQARADLRGYLTKRAQKEVLAGFDEESVMDRVEAFLQRAPGSP